jgi:hypothetical protein
VWRQQRNVQPPNSLLPNVCLLSTLVLSMFGYRVFDYRVLSFHKPFSMSDANNFVPENCTPQT